MSTEFPRRPEKLNEAVRFAIVASEYNRTYVDGLVRFASDELKAIAPLAEISLVRVPDRLKFQLRFRRLPSIKNRMRSSPSD